MGKGISFDGLVGAVIGAVAGMFGRKEQDQVSPTGVVELALYDGEGRLKQKTTVHNLVVNTGLSHIADQLADSGETAMSHMAIGEGTTAAAAGDTALEDEAGDVALTSTTQSTNSVIYVATFGAGVGTGAITEAGIFNAADVMLCRTVFPVVNKQAADFMTVTWTVSFSAV